jgi:hypothetical protein
MRPSSGGCTARGSGESLASVENPLALHTYLAKGYLCNKVILDVESPRMRSIRLP